jgi:4'-phosphopantetheinyl transferase
MPCDKSLARQDMQFDGVEVWTARPEALGPGACDELERVLDPEERMRCSRLRFPADRRAFIVAHSMRRIALGLALGIDAADLRFGTGQHGCPILIGHEGRTPAFSLTRSRGLVACALSHEGSVGIDVESVFDEPDGSLLEPFMTPSAEAQDFYLQWTALEAFWKARGLGLAAGHPRIALQPLDGESLYEVVYGDTRSSAGMLVIRLPAPAGHVLSLACEEPSSVRMVDLEGLAAQPGAGHQTAMPAYGSLLADEAACAAVGPFPV